LIHFYKRMELEIVHAKTSKPVVTLADQQSTTTVGDLKKAIARAKPKYQDVNRQELRLEAKGKFLKDEETLESLGINENTTLFFKDRGTQIGWTTVFLAEYMGPLIVYLLFYTRPWIMYGDTSDKEMSSTAHIAAAAWSFHYAKRVLETIFVHRFSNATMPLGNLFKNCSYYWGFAAYCAYHINHPLYTSPGSTQVYLFLTLFIICELGNFTIHILLRNLRPAGSKERKIPYPNSNPLSQMQSLVSCPNYTYEIGAWISFSIMTSCLPVGLFTLAGAYQMIIWAQGKHRNYKKEFKDYPRRKAIIPFVL